MRSSWCCDDEEDLHGVGSELCVGGYAVPVDLTWASAVLDASEEEEDVLVLRYRSHCQ